MSNSATPWTKVCQASLSFTISRSLLKLMMPSNHLILCHPLLLLLSVFLPSGSFPMSPLLPIGGQSTGALEVLEEYWKSRSGLIFFRTEPILLSFLKSLYWTCCNIVSVSFFFFWPWSIWYLNSPTWYQTHTTCIGRWSLNQQTAREVPILNFFFAWYLTMEK